MAKITRRSTVNVVIDEAQHLKNGNLPISAIKVLRTRWPNLGLSGAHALAIKHWDEFKANPRKLLKRFGG